jgi:hypothetical protein
MGITALITSGVGSSGGSASGPPAPNVTSATAAPTYGLYGNASAYKWSGTITLPSVTAHLMKIIVQWTHAGGTPVTIATLNAPWGSSPIPWTSGVYFDFLQNATAYPSDTIQFLCENELAAITASPVSVAVTVEAAAVTSIASPSEIGPQVVTTDNQNSRLVSTTVSFVPVLGSSQVPQNVTFLVSQDNGVTYVYTGWSLISSVGQAIAVTKISPLTSASWKFAACVGAVGGDPTIFMPAASLAAAFPGVVISASFTVAGLSLPLATAVTGASVGAFSNIVRNDGTQYGHIAPVSYTDPTDLSFFVRVTVEYLNAALGTLIAEAAFSGFNVATGGTVRTTLGLDFPYVAGLAFVRYRIYLSSRTSTNTNDFLNPLLAQLETCWPASANHSDVAVTLPTSWGPGITTSPATNLPVSTVRAESIVLDYGFELTPAGACTALTVSAWTFSITGTATATIMNDTTAYSGSQYLRLTGNSGGSWTVLQSYSVRAGESLYFACYSRGSAAGSGAAVYIQFFTAAGVAVGSASLLANPLGLVSAWTLNESTVAVPATAATAQLEILAGATGAGNTDLDSIRVMPVGRAKSIATSGALGDDGSGNTTAKTGPGMLTVSNALVPNVSGGTLAVNGSGQVIVTNMPAVGFLPSLPSVTYPAGAVIVVTAAATDPSTGLATPANTVYRNATGSQWAASHTPTDLVAGAIASGVTLAAAQVAAGTLIAGVAYIGAIACSQLSAGTIGVSITLTAPTIVVTQAGGGAPFIVNIDVTNAVKVTDATSSRYSSQLLPNQIIAAGADGNNAQLFVRAVSGGYEGYLQMSDGHAGNTVRIYPEISATASAGSATLPGAPLGFLSWLLNGSTIHVPYYS